jgi:hypothetical protein
MTDWIKAAHEATYTVPGFKFADGGELDLRLHYRTLGVLAPDRSNAVLMLHGTTGGGGQFLQPSTADFPFAAGQPLDAGSTSSSCQTPLGMAAPASRVTDWRRPSHVTATPTSLKRNIVS